MNVHLTALKRPILDQLEKGLLNVIADTRLLMTKAQCRTSLLMKTGFPDGLRVKKNNNAPCITARNPEKIFQPSFTNNSNKGGSGLNISFGIISAHGGRLIAGSKLANGTSCILELPVESSQTRNQKKHIKQELISPFKASGGKVRILIIDDETDIREALKRILTSKGYSVEVTSDARTALKTLARQTFHLIILDIKMPHMDGVEFYEQLKEVAPDLRQRVICMSGELVSARNKTFIAKNKLPYLAKPFGIRDLLQKVEAVLS